MKWLSLVLLVFLAAPGRAQSAPPRIIAFAVAPTQQYPSFTGAGYAVTQRYSGGTTEYQCYLNGHHFLSLISADGTFDLRPHPGVDRNGWGSSLYLQPFLSVSDVTLGHTVINNVVATPTGIEISAGGGVSAANQTTYGTWSSALSFSYDPTNKAVAGNGSYAITLPGPLSAATGDLNLYKLASNLLTNVPVLSGGTTNTGDMSVPLIYGSNSIRQIVLPWDPSSQPAHCPPDDFDWQSVTVIGNYNQADTAAQGKCPIQAAYKPTLTVDLTSHQPGLPFRLCAFYTVAEAQNFAADNIGINAIIKNLTAVTDYLFDVAFRSTALPQDGIGIDATLTATFPTNDSAVAVFCASSLRGQFNRLVGSLPWISSNTCQGTVGVPYPPTGGLSPTQGFFRATATCSHAP
jgi:hypothetical protein